MFPQINNNDKKQQPKANDPNVIEKIREEEEPKSVQPGGNEVMAAMLSNMLKAANSDNMLDLSGYEDQEEEIIP